MALDWIVGIQGSLRDEDPQDQVDGYSRERSRDYGYQYVQEPDQPHAPAGPLGKAAAYASEDSMLTRPSQRRAISHRSLPKIRSRIFRVNQGGGLTGSCLLAARTFGKKSP